MLNRVMNFCGHLPESAISPPASGPRGGVVLALLLLWSLTSVADEQSFRLLEGMSQALQQLNYRGELVYQSGGEIQSVRIIHGFAPERASEYEMMESLNGPKRSVVRGEGAVHYALNGEPIELQSGATLLPFKFSSVEDLQRIEPYYQMRIEGKERIAGRDTIKLQVVPRDHYRYGFRLWIAEGSSMLLKSEMSNQQGEVLEGLMFTSLKLLPSLPQEFTLHNTLSPQQTPERGAEQPGAKRSDGSSQSYRLQWQVATLPPGFSVVTARVEPHFVMEGREKVVEHHLYSDGIASVSLFIEGVTTGGEPEPGEISHLGAITMMTQSYDGYRATVVGEVPPPTVLQIARSVVLRE
ncbi:MAG: MucB/RseB C-terminal domain-containing protein [Gammaproteobacteria bacterium]|nr:MucB/RseB C-terminal domain-containing protein [Gammaproteobacteria bacterium]